jgi:hypothetical protein
MSVVESDWPLGNGWIEIVDIHNLGAVSIQFAYVISIATFMLRFVHSTHDSNIVTYSCSINRNSILEPAMQITCAG